MIQRDGDRKAAYRTGWIARNPDARVTNLADYLGKEWKRVNAAVQGERLGVTLLSGRLPIFKSPSYSIDPFEEVGIVLPADLVYTFHARVNDERQYFPVQHIDARTFFKSGPELLKKAQSDYTHYVLLDEGKPIAAVAHVDFRERAVDIVEANGHIELTPERKRNFLNTFVPKFNVDFETAAKVLRKYRFGISGEQLEDYARARSNPMDDQNNAILDQVVERLGAVRERTPQENAKIVSNLRINTENRLVLSVS